MFPILNPPPSPYHPSGSSQCTSPKHLVSCIEPGLVIHFTCDNIHVSMPFSQIIPPLPSPTESKRLFYASVSFAVLHMGLSLPSFKIIPVESTVSNHLISFILFYFFLFFQFYFIFKLYIIVLVLPNIKMNPPQVYMCSPSRTLDRKSVV